MIRPKNWHGLLFVLSLLKTPSMPRGGSKAISSSQGGRAKSLAPAASERASIGLKRRRKQYEDDREDNESLDLVSSDDEGTSPNGHDGGNTLNTSIIMKLLSRIADLLHSQNSLVLELRDLRQDYRKIQTSYDALLTRVEGLEGVASRVNPQADHGRYMEATAGNVGSMTANVADELIERREKEMNVIFHGYEEISDGDASGEEERVAATQFIQTQLAVAEPDLTQASRLGRRQPGRPRPLRVTFSNCNKRLHTLAAARSLSKLPSADKFSSIYIKPDLTRLQREQDFLRRQAKRNGNISTNNSARSNSSQNRILQSQNSTQPK